MGLGSDPAFTPGRPHPLPSPSHRLTCAGPVRWLSLAALIMIACPCD
jgi:hypothetical protein